VVSGVEKPAWETRTQLLGLFLFDTFVRPDPLIDIKTIIVGWESQCPARLQPSKF
jgi:hypothetical protein